MNPGPHWIVWLAQGMGIGRIPVAPGTWGSVLGVAWFLLLLAPASDWFFFGGALAGVWGAVPVCGRAESLLHRRDPPSVVLDEIVAVPWCYALPLMTPGGIGGALEGLPAGARLPILLLSGFLLFRLFDIWKPWPIRQSQRLPGGWGVVMDDVLAAVYVNLVLLAAWGVLRWAA